jgi:L-threonylcarbamoyladenylate synthase
MKYDMFKEIITSLNHGGVVIMPADTVYGLFCRAGDAKAVKQIYKIKGRDYEKPLQVFLPDVKSITKYAAVNPAKKKLVKKYLPGAYTLILKLKAGSKKKFAFLKTGTIGIRVIKSKILGPILLKTGPLAATSANISGAKPPVKFKDIPFELRSRVELSVICDRAVKGKPSKVVDITRQKTIVLRA